MANGGNRALCDALRRKKAIAEVKPLVTKEAADARDPYYSLRPLFWALTYKAPVEIVRQLLDACPEAIEDRHPADNCTPLHYAERLDADTVKLLIERCPGAAAKRDGNGMLPLHWVAEHDAPLAVAKLLLAAHPAAVGEKDYSERTPYRLAVDSGAAEALEDFLAEASPEEVESLRRLDLQIKEEEASKKKKKKTEVLASRSPEVPTLPDGSPAGEPPVGEEAPLPVGLIFPGQGSQYVKMLHDAQNIPAVRAMLSEAQEILGFDLLDICLTGPESRLEETVHCQPAMYVAGLAALERLRGQRPEAVERCRAVAGLSLGEYTALAAAGVLSFGDGLRLVKARAEAMNEAAKLRPQAMMSVAGLPERKVREICAEAVAKAGAGEVCQISNFLFEKGFTVGGTKAAIEECIALAQDAKAMQARPIKAGGGFHTPLMDSAVPKLVAALEEALPKMRSPRCDVYMNATGEALRPGSTPREIVDLLTKQLTNEVQWVLCARNMIAEGVEEFYECGPMKQLKAMMKRIDQDAWSKTTNIEV